jgi:hypothetical protein
MPQLVKLGDPLQRRDRQPEHPALPALMEDRLVALDRDCAEPVEAAEVMDAIRALDLTNRRPLPPDRAARPLVHGFDALRLNASVPWALVDGIRLEQVEVL